MEIAGDGGFPDYRYMVGNDKYFDEMTVEVNYYIVVVDISVSAGVTFGTGREVGRDDVGVGGGGGVSFGVDNSRGGKTLPVVGHHHPLASH